MVPIHELPRLWEGIDVGLVPMADKPSNFGAKSCLKGLEASAAGLPFVASASSEYRWLRDSLGVGRVAAKPVDWRRHLVALLDPEVRAAEGAENRAAVAKALNPSIAGAAWERLLLNLAP